MKEKWIKLIFAVCMIAILGTSIFASSAMQENRQLKEEIKQLEKENEQLKKEVRQSKEESKQLKEKDKQLEAESQNQSNLIDEFWHNHIKSKAYTTMEMTKQEEIYKDCWKKELEHAYKIVLERATTEDMKQTVKVSKEGFFAFAENYAQMEIYTLVSELFSKNGQEPFGSGGTTTWMEIYAVEGNLYKQLTLKLYELMDCTKDDFIFDGKELLKSLDENEIEYEYIP